MLHQTTWYTAIARLLSMQWKIGIHFQVSASLEFYIAFNLRFGQMEDAHFDNLIVYRELFIDRWFPSFSAHRSLNRCRNRLQFTFLALALLNVNWTVFHCQVNSFINCAGSLIEKSFYVLRIDFALNTFAGHKSRSYAAAACDTHKNRYDSS